MNKSVLISIQPKWCELIASGKKTLEIRKTRPQHDLSFKCYIYCTQNEFLALKSNGEFWKAKRNSLIMPNDSVQLSGKVIGEFVCDSIYIRPVNLMHLPNVQNAYLAMLESACLTEPEARAYMGGQYNKDMYFWHISDLKIYDTPKELSEFKRKCEQYGSDNPNCDGCKFFIDGRSYEYDESDCAFAGRPPLTRPPQSWCYCEELSE